MFGHSLDGDAQRKFRMRALLADLHTKHRPNGPAHMSGALPTHPLPNHPSLPACPVLALPIAPNLADRVYRIRQSRLLHCINFVLAVQKSRNSRPRLLQSAVCTGKRQY